MKGHAAACSRAKVGCSSPSSSDVVGTAWVWGRTQQHGCLLPSADQQAQTAAAREEAVAVLGLAALILDAALEGKMI